LISYFPIMFLEFCMSDFEIVPVAPVITGIIPVFTFHKHYISSARFYSLKPLRLLYWSHFCLLKLLCLLTGMFFFPLSRTMMSSLLLEMVLAVCTCWFQNMFTLLSQLMAMPLFLV
jgi:hypothetical protein